MTRSRSLALALLVLAACGPAPAPAPDEGEGGTSGAGGEREGAGAAASTASDRRELRADATFAELAEAARFQDQRRDSESSAACILRSRPAGMRLDADLAVAVRPLAAPPEDLDARLARGAAPPRVLSRFASYGPAAARLGLTAMTTTRPPREIVAGVLFVTDQGVYARRTDREVEARAALAIEAALAQLEGVETLFVTAEAGVPLVRLAEVLAAIPAELVGRVGLAVVLGEDVRLPEPAPESEVEDGAPVCPDGLPELGEDDPEDGDLPLEELQRGLAPLASAAASCAGATTGAGAGGGRIVLAMRVMPGGRVRAACVMEDAADDPALRACLVRAATELAFADPGGVLDLALPLDLAPGPPYRQVPLCH